MSKEEAKKQKENRERFVESGTRRVTKIVDSISSLEQFRSENYDYSAKDVELIRSTIQKQLDETVKILLNPETKKTAISFQ